MNKKMVFFFVVSFALLLLAYVPDFFGGFFIVDDSALIEIPQLQLPLSWKLIQTLFRPGSHVDFYPIRDFSYWIDLHIFGARSDGANGYIFRIHNFFLFLGIALGLMAFLNQLIKNKVFSLFCASLWLLNPFHFEMVWWISARKDLLALFFFSWSAVFWMRFQKEAKIYPGVFSLLFFLLSLLSKTTFLLVPPVLLLTKLLQKTFDRKDISLVIASMASVVWGFVQNWQYTAVNDMRFYYPLSYRFYASLTALGRMLAGIFYWPVNSVDLFNWGEWLDLNHSFLIAGYLFWVLILAWLIFSYKKRSGAFCAPALFLAVYLPISSFTFPHRNFYSTRYFEGPFLVLTAASALSVHNYFKLLPHRKTFFSVLGLLMFLWFFIGLNLESRNWDSNRAILEKSLRITPRNIASKVLFLQELTNLKKQNQWQAQDRELLNLQESQLNAYCMPYLKKEILGSSTLCSVFFSHVLALIEEKKKVQGKEDWAIFNKWLESFYAYRTHTPIQEVMDKNWARRVLYSNERTYPPKEPKFFTKEKQKSEWTQGIERFNSIKEQKSF